jgi:dephospho-CoA kinase
LREAFIKEAHGADFRSRRGCAKFADEVASTAVCRLLVGRIPRTKLIEPFDPPLKSRALSSRWSYPVLVSRSHLSLSCFEAFPERSHSRHWKHGSIPVIGLTGVIGSGKSRFAALLGQRGAVVIDADSVGHEVLDQPEITRRVVQRFGPGVLRSEGGVKDWLIDRRALGSIVFADPAARRELEAIVHPEMFRRFEAAIMFESGRGLAPAIILDAAILFEAGWNALCDLVVFLDASLPVRLGRVARDRGWTAEVLRAREVAQWSADAKSERSDIRIRNDAGLEALEQNADRLFALATTPSRGTPPLFDGNGGRLVGHSYQPVPAAPGDAR